MYYVAVIDKDADSAYGVRFPDVPGCYSAADTFDEIVPNAMEALALFFEDRDVVPPRGLEAVRREVAEDLAAGAVLMMIPIAPKALEASFPRKRESTTPEKPGLPPTRE